ncbi:LysM peptidoglycan-binding domain-containing protein [Algiphilus sp. W345]|uniref:LysM peptidoglycan-binding domain-containing protein n=1 Tax=Banduia mediterranea TaxID=3075609 RepID=A0ABU2WK62_9GAMM|nr:LysM peptidoglycan-binding domain-containing protein [Algiphilus sp. W345]MDT0498260.1 LysM peptidoglycan-binding domain-containing protein [Algiphilus sp. W345]
MIGLTLAARRLAVALLLLLTALPGQAAEQIWPRVCEGMSLHGEAQPQVQKWRGYYSSHPRRVRSLLAPSEPWLWHIVRAIDERGFPMEIALLPVIESNYNPSARSPGGAEGLWQFVGVTARNHGLRETDWYDGRRDALASTDAALDYLANLHDLFDNWLLALAAYNVGENRLIAEQRKQRAAGLPRNFWKMPLPEETRGHVPRLLGLALAVCGDDMRLPEIKDTPVTDIVQLPGQIDLQVASDWSGVPLSTLFAINPGLRYSVTDPDGPHRLLMPIRNIEKFKLRLASADQSEFVRYARHTVASGDNLSSIAQRYGSSVGAIQRTNRLSGTLIKAGHTLMIPKGGRPASTLKPPLVASTTTSRRQKAEYVVQAGDSLSVLAQRFGVSQKELESWNDLSRSGVLRIGRKLVIWLPQDGDSNSERSPDA